MTAETPSSAEQVWLAFESALKAVTNAPKDKVEAHLRQTDLTGEPPFFEADMRALEAALKAVDALTNAPKDSVDAPAAAASPTSISGCIEESNRGSSAANTKALQAKRPSSYALS